MPLDAVIERIWRCPWMPWSSAFGDALGCRDGANLEALIERVWCYTWMAWSCKLAGRNRASLEIHLEAMIERDWWCTCRPCSCGFEDTFGGHDRASVEIHLEAAIEQVWRYTWRLWSSECVDALGGRNRVSLDKYWEEVDGWRTRCWDSVHQLVNSELCECDKVTLPLSSHWELADGGRLCREARRKLKLHSGVNS